MTELNSQDWTVSSLSSFNSYQSCIKYNGRSILPPVVSNFYKNELRELQQKAIEIEKRLATKRTTEVDYESVTSPKHEDPPIIEATEVDSSQFAINPELPMQVVVSHGPPTLPVYVSKCCGTDESHDTNVLQMSPNTSNASSDSKPSPDIEESSSHADYNKPFDTQGDFKVGQRFLDTTHKPMRMVFTDNANSDNIPCPNIQDPSSYEDYRKPFDTQSDLGVGQRFFDSTHRPIRNAHSESDTMHIESCSSDESSNELLASEADCLSMETVVSNKYENKVESYDSDSVVTSAARSSSLDRYIDITDDGHTSETSTAIGDRSLLSQCLHTSNSVDSAWENGSVTPQCLEGVLDGHTFVIDRKQRRVPSALSTNQTLDSHSLSSSSRVESLDEKPSGWVSKVLQKAHGLASRSTSTSPPTEDTSPSGHPTSSATEDTSPSGHNASSAKEDATPTGCHIRRKSYTLEAPSPALMMYHNVCRCDTSPQSTSPCLSAMCRYKTSGASPASCEFSPTITGDQKAPNVRLHKGIPHKLEFETGDSVEVTEKNVQQPIDLKLSSDVQLLSIRCAKNDEPDGIAEVSHALQSSLSGDVELGNKESDLMHDSEDALTVYKNLKEAHSKKVEQLLQQQHIEWMKLQEEFEVKEKQMQQLMQHSKSPTKEVSLPISQTQPKDDSKETSADVAIQTKVPSTLVRNRTFRVTTPTSSQAKDVEANPRDISISPPKNNQWISIINAVQDPIMIKKFEKVSAAVKGYLTRRLLISRHVQNLLNKLLEVADSVAMLQDVNQNISSSVSIAENLELHRNMARQLEEAHSNFYNVFFHTSVRRQMQIISESRELDKLEELKAVVEHSESKPGVDMQKDWLIHPHPQFTFKVPPKKPLTSATLKSLERKRSLSNKSHSVASFYTKKTPKTLGTQRLCSGTKSSSPLPAKMHPKRMSPYLKTSPLKRRNPRHSNRSHSAQQKIFREGVS